MYTSFILYVKRIIIQLKMYLQTSYFLILNKINCMFTYALLSTSFTYDFLWLSVCIPGQQILSQMHLLVCLTSLRFHYRPVLNFTEATASEARYSREKYKPKLLFSLSLSLPLFLSLSLSFFLFVSLLFSLSFSLSKWFYLK